MVSVVVTAGVEASTSAPVVNVPDGPNVVWPTWVVLPPSLDSTRWTYTRHVPNMSVWKKSGSGSPLPPPTFDIATMPGKPTSVPDVSPRIRSREAPVESVVIRVSKPAFVFCTAPTAPSKVTQPNETGPSERRARTVPSERSRSASVHPLSPWNVIDPLVQAASPALTAFVLGVSS